MLTPDTTERARTKTRSNLLHVLAGLFGGGKALATLVTSTATAATNTARSASPALAAATAVRCRAIHCIQPREKIPKAYMVLLSRKRIVSTDVAGALEMARSV